MICVMHVWVVCMCNIVRWCGMYVCHVVGGVVCMYVMW